MNRTDRLLAIIIELQGKSVCRAEDLARRFGVTKRTIYRDVQALSEAGVPISAEAGIGYSIIDGYFLPPVNFTSDEAIMLLLGADFVAQNFDKQYRNAAHAASSKIEAVLSRELKKEIQALKSGIRFFSMSPLENPVLIERLKKIRRAILSSTTLRFQYHKRYGETNPDLSLRNVDPYVLTSISGNWLMGGWDHARKALRMFRLSRMERVELTSRQFTRPKRFSMKDFGKEESPRLTARLLFDQKVARWVLESRPYFVRSHRSTPRGLVVTVHFSRMDQILPWLLSWGPEVEVLSPASVKQVHAEYARNVVEKYRG